MKIMLNWASVHTRTAIECDFCDSTVKLSRHADLKIRASHIG